MLTQVDPGLTLAMETSGDVCSVAVLRSDLLVSEHIFRHGMHLSERLLDHVDAVLRDADSTPGQIDLYAVGVGPGSFTGTRIGVMTIKTFASLLARPVYGIDSLAAMARAYSGVRDTLIAPMLPCRSGIAYTGMYDVSSGEPVALHMPDALAIADLAQVAVDCGHSALMFCGPASVRYRADIEASLGANAARAVFGDVMYARAADIAVMASRKRVAGILPDDALELVPHYVSLPPITMPKTHGAPS